MSKNSYLTFVETWRHTFNWKVKVDGNEVNNEEATN